MQVNTAPAKAMQPDSNNLQTRRGGQAWIGWAMLYCALLAVSFYLN